MNLDTIVFGVYLLIVAVVGILASRKKEESDDYFLASRNLTWWIIGGSMIAANISTHHFIGMSGRAVEAAGDVDVLLLDKTGTITLGNRQAVEFIPVNGVNAHELAESAQLASLADETPEGRSIVVLAKEKYGLRGRKVGTWGVVGCFSFQGNAFARSAYRLCIQWQRHPAGPAIPASASRRL